MGLLVDTGVWSLALRRDTPAGVPEVDALARALLGGDVVVSTGMVLLELLRGFVPSRARAAIQTSFDALDLIEPTRVDYVEAAAVATRCRAAGLQIGSVDALIARLAIAGDHVLLTTDRDFHHAARHVDLQVWVPGASR